MVGILCLCCLTCSGMSCLLFGALVRFAMLPGEPAAARDELDVPNDNIDNNDEV